MTIMISVVLCPSKLVDIYNILSHVSQQQHTRFSSCSVWWTIFFCDYSVRVYDA